LTHATDLLATPSALVILSAAKDLGLWLCVRIHAGIT
jgi:hypothetical protein